MKTKKGQKVNIQTGKLNFNYEVPVIPVSIRQCPNSAQHTVFGTPFSHGGRQWLCADCGIEWRASLRTGYMNYYEITESGGEKLLKKIHLRYYPEIQKPIKEVNG